MTAVKFRHFLGAALVCGAAMGAAVQPAPACAAQCLDVPVTCRVTSAFGPRYNPITKNFSSEYHHGVDFGCPMGTPIKAAASGIVNISGFSQTAGNWVVVRSPGASGPTFKYMHAERNLVSAGNMVAEGQELSLSGSTGRSTGPHLHFQMEVGGKAVDPMGDFCSKPPLKDGILQGAPPQTDIADAGSQSTPPSDSGGTPPAMGLDGSLYEVLGDVIASRALNPDYMRQLSTLTEPRLFAELAYMKAIRLKIQNERAQHRERIEATQAMIEVLMAERSLRPQLDAQRTAAVRSTAVTSR